MKLIIPYGIRFNTGGEIEVVPVAHVKIRSSKDPKEILGIFVVDSGANISLLPASDARALGISLEAGEKIYVRGITGRGLTGYRHKITMELEGFRLSSVPVIFAKQEGAPRVLGREGVFPHLGIFFDEAKRRIALLDNRNEREKIESLFN